MEAVMCKEKECICERKWTSGWLFLIPQLTELTTLWFIIELTEAVNTTYANVVEISSDLENISIPKLIIKALRDPIMSKTINYTRPKSFSAYSICLFCLINCLGKTQTERFCNIFETFKSLQIQSAPKLINFWHF